MTDRTFFYESTELAKELGDRTGEMPAQTLSDLAEPSEDRGGTYTGQWKKVADGEDVRQGKGELVRANGERYFGFFLDNKFHGKGRFQFAEDDAEGRASYQGCFKDGCFHGWGTMAMKNGDVYKAKWDAHQISG